MLFNASKCYVLSIHRETSPVIHYYKIKGQLLEHVQRHQYLGVTISNDLNLRYHVENIVGKASRTLGFIKKKPQTLLTVMGKNKLTRHSFISSNLVPHLMHFFWHERKNHHIL